MYPSIFTYLQLCSGSRRGKVIYSFCGTNSKQPVYCFMVTATKTKNLFYSASFLQHATRAQ